MFLTSCSVCGAKAFDDDGWTFNGHDEAFCPLHADAVPVLERPPTVEPETRGFDRPEDGAEARYHERRTDRPWAAHTFWWMVHNAVAHPLIAVFPRRRFFRFHDWTSRKMHGR